MLANILLGLLVVCVCSVKVSDLHQVIIIGAGISGLAASKRLSEAGVEHLILESRERIGGRIHQIVFDGVKVELGASYVHASSKDALRIIMQEMGWWAHKNKVSEQFLYEHEGAIGSQIEDDAYDIHDKLREKVVHNTFIARDDISVAAAGREFMNSVVSQKEEHIRDTVHWLSNIKANTEGSDLDQLSARQASIDDDLRDFKPHGGYSTFLKALLKRSKGKLHLSERVVKVAYGTKNIEVTTARGKTYLAKRLISSLPLGVLKAKSVKFVPPLSERETSLIDKIGMGNLNKLFVSFTSCFWGNSTGWLNFVAPKSEHNKYPVAVVQPAPGKHILCFFIAGKYGGQIQRLSDQQIADDIVQQMGKFYSGKEIKVKQLKLTHWDGDQNSLGSYSFYKVGTTQEDIIELRQPIANRIWFVGEHTHPIMSSMTQGAFQTGSWAAEEVILSLIYKVVKHQEMMSETEDSSDSSDSAGSSDSDPTDK